MPDCVLFSPIGMTDPARDGHDGPFLHILRHYKPKKVVLYLTKETWELHERDNRYLDMAKKVCNLCKFHTSFEVIGDRTLEDAHRFEIFDAPFREALERLHLGNPRCDILVNISSGTPQMEAALYMLKATLPFPIRPIQVPSHKKRANLVQEYDPACFDTLQDNAPDAKHRYEEVHCENARFTLLKRNISQFIHHYDYKAALQLTEGSEDGFSPDFLCLLKAAEERLSLHAEAARTRLNDHFAHQDVSLVSAWFEEASPELTQIYEYLLMLGTLVQRGTYGDFARAFSPALVAVMRMALLHHEGTDILTLCNQPFPGEYRLSPAKVQQAKPDWFRILDSSWQGGFRESNLNTTMMQRLLEGFYPSGQLHTLKRLREFEQQVRNKAAHQIVPITDGNIRQWMTRGKRAGESAEQIHGMLRDAFAYASGRAYRWDGYGRMNEDLQLYLRDGMG